MKVGIVGLGLIGGSMAIDLKRKGFASEVLGVEAEPVNAAAAEKIGLVDRVVSYEDCIMSSDIVVLAVPVGSAVKMLPDILDRFARKADFLVVDKVDKALQIGSVLQIEGGTGGVVPRRVRGRAVPRRFRRVGNCFGDAVVWICFCGKRLLLRCAGGEG